MKQLLVGGTALCGSTVAKRSIFQHPRVTAMSRELRIHIDPGGAIDLHRSFTDEWSVYRADAALNDFTQLLKDVTSESTSPRYSSPKIDQWVGEDEFYNLSQTLFRHLIDHTTEGTWTGITRDYIHETSPKSDEEMAELLGDFFNGLYQARDDDAEAWVEDSPYTSQFVPRLRRIFPEMVFVHVYRHPYDVLESHMTRRSDRGGWTADTVEANCWRIRNLLMEWWKDRESLPDDSYIEVALSDLTENTDVEMQRIFSKANMDWPEGLWTPLDPEKNRSGRYNLSDEDMETVRDVLCPVAEMMGYGEV